MNVDLWVMKGEYDAELKWPAEAKFTIELISELISRMETTLGTNLTKHIKYYHRLLSVQVSLHKTL